MTAIPHPHRRGLLAASAALAAAPFAGARAQHAHAGHAAHATTPLANRAAPLPERVKLKLTWNATSLCTSPIAVADREGIFARYNLDVELINFGASTEALLEAIATGHADAGGARHEAQASRRSRDAGHILGRP